MNIFHKWGKPVPYGVVDTWETTHHLKLGQLCNKCPAIRKDKS